MPCTFGPYVLIGFSTRTISAMDESANLTLSIYLSFTVSFTDYASHRIPTNSCLLYLFNSRPSNRCLLSKTRTFNESFRVRGGHGSNAQRQVRHVSRSRLARHSSSGTPRKYGMVYEGKRDAYAENTRTVREPKYSTECQPAGYLAWNSLIV